MAFIKPDPDMLQEEQEDLIMSYLNVDYLSTDTPLSPPSSTTSSSSETTGSPEKHSMDDDFMLDIHTDFLNGGVGVGIGGGIGGIGGIGVGVGIGIGGGGGGGSGDQHAWTTTNNTNDLFNPCLPQQHHPSDLLNAFPFFLPTMDIATSPFIQPLPVTLSPSNNVTNEQAKKRRGRKKRDTTAPASCVPQQPSLLAPKPLAPRPDVHIKQEPMVIDVSSSHRLSPLAGPTTMMNETATATTTTTTTTTTATTATTATATTINQLEPQQQKQISPPSIEAQKQAQIQKRQERLIKNRAAALLSRKRKREHLSLLEEEKNSLLMENETLVHKVDTLESRIQSLERENLDLKKRLEPHPSDTAAAIHVGTKRNLVHHGQKPSKATGVVFMIILFSFALFTLPSRTSDRLTVGGSSVLPKKQFPLIGSSSSSSSSSDESDYSVEQFCQQHAEYCDQANTLTAAVAAAAPSNDNLVLIDSVRPRDLQTWINHKLDVSRNQSQESNKKLIACATETSDNVYLYSKEFSQLASMHSSSQPQTKDNAPPTLSLVSPYNQTATTQDSYLQIDVQVLRSHVIKGQLLSLQQYGSASTALLDGMKKDLLSSNVTRSTKREDLIVKREKRAKKISRVII